MSTDAHPGAQMLLRDAQRVRGEYEALRSDLFDHGRYPNRDEKLRLKQLRQEANDLVAVIETLLLEEE